MEQVTSKTARIISLHEEGLTVSEISKRLDIRYQFVYNTLKTKQLTPHVSERTSESKTSVIRELLKTGRSKRSIARELGVQWQYVHQVYKKYVEVDKYNQQEDAE